MTWTQEDRQQLAELCREHDRFMAEACEDERWRQEYDNSEPVPAPESEFGASYPAYDDLMKGLCQFVVEWTREKLAPRDGRLTRLEAKVETLTALLAQRPGAPGKGADVIDLPDWRKRTDAA